MSTKFITVNIEIMHDKKLSPNQKFILAEIHQLSSLEKGCFATNRHFSELIGISIQGVSNAIVDLAKKGYIKIDNSNTNRNYGRIITIHSDVGGIHSDVGGIHSDVGGIHSDVGGIHSDVESKGNKTTNTTFNKTTNTKNNKKEKTFPANLNLPAVKKVTNEIVTNPESYFVANHLLEKIKTNQPNFKQPNIDAWTKDIDKAIRLDNRSKQELINCIDYIYSQAGSFWQSNILSGKKLREKFDTIEIQSKSRRTKQTVQEHAESMSDISPYDLLIEEDRLQKLEQERLLNE